MFAPDRDKIFADIDVSHSCEVAGCPLYRPERNLCDSLTKDYCVRTTKVAEEVNRFIGDNDDVFMYVKPINE